MPIGRVFGDLSVFDLLGNFVPGVVVLSTVTLLLPPDRVAQLSSSPLVAAFFLGVVSFALGHLVQSYAAQAVGNRETFRNSILINQSLAQAEVLNFEDRPTEHPLLYQPYEWFHPDEPEESELPTGVDEDDTDSVADVPASQTIVGRLGRIPARCYRSVVEAIGMVRIKRDRPLDDVTLAGKTWRICRKKYDLDRHYHQYGDLLHLLSSEIETTARSSRALRFQALRNFHRGMWIASYFSVLLLGAVAVARTFPERVTSIVELVGLTVWKPVVVELWTPIWLLCLGYTAILYLFWELKEDFEEEFVEYLLTDFVAIHTEIAEENGEQSDRRPPEVPNWFR